MRSAVLDDDWRKVQSALESSGDLTGETSALPIGCVVPQETLDEVKLLRAEASNRQIIALAKDALTQGGPKGDVGHLNLTLIEVQPLEDAVEQALCFGPETAEARCLVATCIHLRAVRLSLMAGQWDRLQHYVDYADGVASRFGAGPIGLDLLQAATEQQLQSAKGRDADEHAPRLPLPDASSGDSPSQSSRSASAWHAQSAGRGLGIHG